MYFPNVSSMAYGAQNDGNPLHLHITSLTFQSPFATVGIFLTPACEAVGAGSVLFSETQGREVNRELGPEPRGPLTARRGGGRVAGKLKTCSYCSPAWGHDHGEAGPARL